MKDLFIAINKIQTLDYLVDSDAEVFCRKFNECYCRITERYHACRTHLNHGNIAEAVKIAEQPPPLIEAIRLLMTLDFTPYEEFCQRNSFSCPDFIHNSKLERLATDYCRLATLEPLKAFYTKILLEKNIFMGLTLLRRLIMIDPDKHNWINNIKPLEKQYLKDVLNQIKHLTSHRDFHALAAARNELLGNHWYSTLPEHFEQTIENKYLSLKNAFYQYRASLAITALLAEFDPTYPLDCADRIKAIEAFLVNTDYEPPAEYLDLKHKINTAVNTYEKQRQFDLVADELRLLLEQNDCDKVVLESTLDKLKRFELPIPDRLDIRTVNKITGVELFKQRKHRFKRLLLLLGLLLIMALVGVSLFFFQRRKQCNEVCREIGKLVKSGKYSQAVAFYEKSRNMMPFIATYPQLLAARSNLDEAIRNKHAQDKAFITLKKQLIKVRSAGFPGSREQLTLMLADATKYADDDLEKIFIKQFKVDYETVLNKRRQAAINAFNLIIADVSERLRNYGEWEKFSPQQQISELKSIRDRLLTGEKYVKVLNEDNRLRYAEYKTEIKQRLAKARQQQEIVDNATKSFDNLLVKPPDSLGLYVNAIKIIHDNVRHDKRYRKILLYGELMEELQTVYGQGAEASLDNVADKWLSWRTDYQTLQSVLNAPAKKALRKFIASYLIKSLSRITVRRKLSEEKAASYYLSSLDYNQHWGKYNVMIYHSGDDGKVVPMAHAYRKTEYYVKIDKQLYHTKYAVDTSWLNNAGKDTPPALLFFDKYVKPVCEDSKVPFPIKLLAIKALINSLPLKSQFFAHELKPFKALQATPILSDWLASSTDIGAKRHQAIALKYYKLYRHNMLDELAVIMDKYRGIVAMYRWAVSPYFILSGVVDYAEPNPIRKKVKYLFAIGYRKVKGKDCYYPKIDFVKQNKGYRRLATDGELFNGMPLLGLRMEYDFEKYVKFSKKYNIVPDLFKAIRGK